MDQSISPDEVQKHCCADSAWIALFGFVYDVTDFLPAHPGGQAVLLSAAGKDVTKVWSSLHKKEWLETYLQPECCLGRLTRCENGMQLEEHQFAKPQEMSASKDDITYSTTEDPKVLKIRTKRAQAVNIGYTMQIIDSLIQLQSGGGFGKHNYMERIVSLVEERGDPNCTDQDGQGGITPLGVAATIGSHEQVQRLLDAKADPQYSTERDVSILHKFAARPLPDASASAILSILLQAGCNINAQMGNGRTPLHVAAQWGQPDMVRMMLRNGANRRMRAGIDGSAADWARRAVVDKIKLKSVLQALESK